MNGLSKNELELLLEIAKEENDDSTFKDIVKDFETLEQAIEDLELRRMLGGKDDNKNALITIHPGAGGTESQDWAEMLFRMYLRHAQRSQYKTSILDLTTGDEAGIMINNAFST